jgi:hypothetical protein
MHARLVSYLKDNRDQILENWLTEAEVPAPSDHGNAIAGGGINPFTFYADAFDSILHHLKNGKLERTAKNVLHLNEFLGMTCDCKQRCFGGRVCIELHDSGLNAFMSVFAEEWDTEHEFSELDRKHSEARINDALSDFFGKEIELCHHKNFRSDCPFVAHG